jgi:hypothetical protein
VAVTAPVPRPHHRFGRCCDRWMTISRHPEPCADPRPFLAVRSTRDSSFRSTYPMAVSPTNEREELDPCSLDPAALFGARLPSLFEARRRLPTSATTIRRAGNQTRALAILAGREATTSILFFRARRLSLAGVADTRRAALRPFVMAPVLVPPTCAGLPSRDATSSAPPPRLRVHMGSFGPGRRYKDVRCFLRKRRTAAICT